MKLFNAFGKTENRAHTLNTKNWIKLKKKKKKMNTFHQTHNTFFKRYIKNNLPYFSL